MEKFNFGENLRAIRQQKGIKQETMAQHLKISQATYSRIEKQSTTEDYEQVLAIANFLEVNVVELMPEWEGIDPKAIHLRYGTEVERRIKKIIDHPIGLIAFVGASAGLIDAAYQVAYGICDSLETSDATLITTRWIAAFTTMGIIVYWFWRIKRLK